MHYLQNMVDVDACRYRAPLEFVANVSFTPPPAKKLVRRLSSWVGSNAGAPLRHSTPHGHQRSFLQFTVRNGTARSADVRPYSTVHPNGLPHPSDRRYGCSQAQPKLGAALSNPAGQLE